MSRDRLHVEIYFLVKIKQIFGQGNNKKDMVLHYIFKAVFGKYNNKWWPIPTPRKEWSDSVGCGSYEMLVKMVEEHMGS